MAARWPIVVGITVILVSVAWFARRTTKPDSPNPARPAGSVPLTTTSRPSVAAPANPALPADTPRPALPAEAAFVAQARDAEWASATEAELRRRYRAVRGARLEDAECRHSQCRLVVAGTEADVGQAIADLEGARSGLRGYATSLVLSAPERRPDGRVVLRAFALFDR